MAKRFFIGVDLGGTKISAILCDAECRILARARTGTDAGSGARSVLGRIKDAIRQVMAQGGVSISDVGAIGVCSPGPLSVSGGVVLYAATLGWRDVPIRQELEDEFNLPVCLENDCNAAAYGELMLGAGRGCNDLIYITVSTGVGSGIVAGGRIVHGKHDAAGEFGHISVEPGGRLCSCGNRGCLQAYASGTSIVQIAEEGRLAHPGSSLFAATDGSRLTTGMIAGAAREGDGFAKSVWDLAGEKLGQGVSILLQLMDPDIIVIGGGVSKAWDLLYPPMVASASGKVYELIRRDMRIVPAGLGDDAGALGAVLLAMEGQAG